MKRILLLLAVLAIAGAFAPGYAAAQNRVIDDNDIVTLPGNVHALARAEFDAGRAQSALPMGQMILVLRRSPDKQAALEQFLAALQDPSSPDFHRWLTPEAFGERFGLSSGDIAAITGWLASHGFVLASIARGKSWITFSGTAADVERAFHTTIHRYMVGGRLFHANAEDPSIPKGLADIVAGIDSLNDFPRTPLLRAIRPADEPEFTSGSSHYLSPGDFGVIYGVNALYGAGIDGTGQTIAVVGRTHPPGTEWATFRTMMGLPDNPPQVIVNGADPGDLGGNEDVEADLDVEWSGAVARNATIVFVTSATVDLSAQYIVDNKVAPVMTTSFGACEASLGTSENQFYDSLWSQAAGVGITAFVASGDSGAAGCDSPSESTAVYGRAVNGLASTPYNVAVGGSEFNEGSGTYWSGTNNGYTSALSYVPEVAWNESGANGGSDLWATGGGASRKYTKPSWQVAPGVPSDGKRDVPDVSLSAAAHDAYLVWSSGTLYLVSGTSASAPSMAGIMALVVQKTGQPQGNANTRLYQLANAQYGSGGVTVFHDVTLENNNVPGQSGFSAANGYDQATGLGSVDAYALAMNWSPDFTIAASPGTLSVPQGSQGASIVQTTTLGNFTSAVALSASGLPTGVTAAFSPSTIAAPGAGNSTVTFNVSTSAAAGTYPVIVTGSGGGASHNAPITLTIVPSYTVTASVGSGSGAITPTSALIPSGSPAVFTITPGTGYYLASVIDNGANVTSNVSGNTYTIASVTKPHTVVASFAVDIYTINVAESGSGTINDSSGTVSYGGSDTFTMTPAAGYALAALTDNGVPVSPTQGPSGTFTYTITDVTTDHTVRATFSPVAAPVPAMGWWGFFAATLALLLSAMKRKKMA